MAGLQTRTSLDLVEEAACLLRNAPPRAFAAYYLGTLPFALAFLFFWADMGGSATAFEHCAPAALGVAALFLWMSAWQAIFTQGLRSVLTGGGDTSWRVLVMTQASLQPAKLLALPVAALVTVPLAAVFAFYQNLMAVSSEPPQTLRQRIESAVRQARLWPAQNWGALGIVALLGTVIFANIGVLLLLVPQLLKSFFGVQTALARSETLMLNTTFLAITAALTYAIVDPLIKAIYVLRCYYGESLASGEDLKAQLKAIAAASQLVAVIALLCAPGVRAQDLKLPAAAGPPAEQMNRSIDDVLSRPEFSWRLPHRAAPPPQKSWFARTFDSVVDTLSRWSDEFFRWLHERFRPNPARDQGKAGPPALRLWFYVLLGAAIFISLLLLLRSFKRTPRANAAASAPAAAVDFAGDDTRADQLPAEEWLRAARECAARNDFRRAVRALFLANLAYLAGHSLIAIERGKSNRDYERELRRRARSKPEILPLFSDTIGIFERTWYGLHDATAALANRIEANLASTRARVEQ